MELGLPWLRRAWMQRQEGLLNKPQSGVAMPV